MTTGDSMSETSDCCGDGGAYLLGLRGLAVIAHGNSSRRAIANAIRKAAPEIGTVDAEGAVAPATAATDGDLLQIELSPSVVGNGAASPSAAGNGVSGAGNGVGSSGGWAMAGGLPELARGGTLVKSVGGQPVLFLRLDGSFYAYRPECPACDESLSSATLAGTELRCGTCGNHYDVLRAGRCLDSPQLHLEPVPLLVDDDGLVRIALATPA